MEFSLPIFFIVLGLGVLQLAVGVVFGRCLPLGKGGSGPERRHARKLRDFAVRLYRLVGSVADDVDEHHAQIQQVNRELASTLSEDGGGVSEFVLRTVAQIVQINERLQDRLSATEERLQKQTHQIESQIVQARTDPLTGLPNRRAFDDELSRRLAEWRRKSSIFCLLMVDIDHFKQLNDRYGHPVGDHALRCVADVLGNVVREMDMIARVGGEEFAAILPSTNLRDAMRTAERVRLGIAAEKFEIDQTELPLTISVGLAAVKAGDNGISVLKRADEALYCAKGAGRNCAYFHNGKQCRRIDLTDPQDSSGTTAELTSVCNDLRDRLVEIVDEEAP